MNVTITEQADDLQVVISCRKIDAEVLRLKKYIQLFDRKLIAKKEEENCFIPSSDVLYFESVDDRTFLYTQEQVFEIRQRLYELELIFSDRDFVRISKSQIVNLHKISTLKPELNRTILATLCNGEQLSISRKYVPSVRAILSL